LIGILKDAHKKTASKLILKTDSKGNPVFVKIDEAIEEKMT